MRFFFDLVRDKNSSKISTTKVLAVVFSLLTIFWFVMDILILGKSRVDHYVFGEMLAFILALLSVKNYTQEINKKKNDDAKPKSVPDDTTDDAEF